MKYHELVKKHNVIAKVLVRFFELYPDEKKSLDGYIQALIRLSEIEPKIPETDDDKMTIYCEDVADDIPLKGDGNIYQSVSGRKQFPSEDDPENVTRWAIEYCPWNEWLGWDVCDESIKQYGSLDFFCHTLYEITWSGYTDKECQESSDELKIIMDDAKKAISNAFGGSGLVLPEDLEL